MKRSPIEKRLLDALRDMAGAHNVDLRDYSNASPELDLSHPETPRIECVVSPDEYGVDSSDGGEPLSLLVGVQFLTYWLDIVLVSTNGVLCIECDGHDWHDRTKQQAAYDRSRDRELLLRGIPTIRFTGSELHHSAARCAGDCYAIAKHLERQADLRFEGLCATHEREVERKRALGLLPPPPKVEL